MPTDEVLERSIQSSAQHSDATAHKLGSDINLLHRLSNSIRKASKENQDAKAAGDFQWQDDEGFDMSENFRDKFATRILQQRFSRASQVIMKRLAETMLLRRKRYMYRASRQNGREIRLDQSSVVKPSNMAPRLTSTQQESYQKSQPIAQARGTVPSIPSVARTSTTLDIQRFRKTYATSEISVARTAPLIESDEMFPPPPMLFGDVECICPYCSLVLSAAEVKPFERWKWVTQTDPDRFPG